MVPSQAQFELMLQLLGAQSPGFGETTDGPMVILLQQPFVPAPERVIGDLVEADFDGYAGVEANAGPKPQSLDPNNGDSLLKITAPTPYLWETTGLTNLPQTIYGFAVTNNAGTLLLACDTIDPVTLDGINQSIEIPIPTLRQTVGSVI